MPGLCGSGGSSALRGAGSTGLVQGPGDETCCSTRACACSEGLGTPLVGQDHALGPCRQAFGNWYLQSVLLVALFLTRSLLLPWRLPCATSNLSD